jgi:hypothetical protein
MTITHPPVAPPATRSRSDALRSLPTVLTSEWIKLSSVRANKAILGLTVGVCAFASWAVAALVEDEVLTVAQVFVYPTIFAAVFAAVAGILLFTTEAQHGTLAAALTAQPARGVLAAAKTVTAAAFGLVLGAAGMAAGALGALAGGLAPGDTSAMAGTALWALLYTSLAALVGLGVGMVARHSAGAISGLLVWWFVAEATVSRFLPFDAGYHLLQVGSDFDTPERIAAALTRPQYGLVLAGYAAVAAIAGTVLLQRRDTN